MTEPTGVLVYESTSRHHHLKVFYEPERHRYRLEFYPVDRPDERVATSYCDATWEPRFGIDVADKITILNLAETTEDDLLYFAGLKPPKDDD